MTDKSLVLNLFFGKPHIKELRTGKQQGNLQSTIMTFHRDTRTSGCKPLWKMDLNCWQILVKACTQNHTTSIYVFSFIKWTFNPFLV
jgi:hypothetical protein